MKIFLFFCCALFADIDLNLYEKSLYSEQGEDGILAKIFEVVPPTSSFCVEVGAYDGFSKSPTYLLRLQGWKGILFDRQYQSEPLNLYREFINAETINPLFEKYQIPSDFDLLCIDVDYNDFYVWQALNPKYQPRVVMIRYNGTHLPTQDKVVKYRPFYVGDETDYFGASILSLSRLGKAKGYNLIYAEKTGKYLFFLRTDLPLCFKNSNQVEALYRPADKSMEDYRERPYFSWGDL